MSLPRQIGTSPDTDDDYIQRCPVCRAVLTYEDQGYGLAFGGGLGQYMTCSTENCTWFVKWLDADEEVVDER
jgi:hypothetical protein